MSWRSGGSSSRPGEPRPPGTGDGSEAGPARSPEQQRAADALAKARAAEDTTQAGTYRSYVERLGPAILMNGLGQALATERAAGGTDPKPGSRESAHLRLYDHVQAWLCRPGGVYAGKRDVLAAIVEGSEADYLRAQGEALAWLVWHKKFCRAYLPKTERGED